MQIKSQAGLAPVGARLRAFLRDYLIIAGYLVLLSGLSAASGSRLAGWFTAGPVKAELAGFVLLTLPVLLYFAICEGRGAHATWGKRKGGLAVVRAGGGDIGLSRSLLRSALKFLPWELAHFTVWRMARPSDTPEAVLYALLGVVYGLVLLYLLSPYTNRGRRTVYDLLSGTTVVRR